MSGNDGKVEYRTQCPECAKKGRDRKRDNLAVFTDGHSYCFSCAYYIPSPSIERLKSEAERERSRIMHFEVILKTGEIIYTEHPNESSLWLFLSDLDWKDWRPIDPEENKGLSFPIDYIPLLDAKYTSKQALSWLKQYGITDAEILKYKIGWSNDRTMLIYPVFNKNNELLMWQGRNFGEGAKYLTKGPKSDILYVLPKISSGLLIVTEDYVSAIKVGRQFNAAPLWGTDMPLGRIKEAASAYDALGVWLDPGKEMKAVETALRASQYIPTFVITSLKDPKCYNDEAIVQFVEAHSLKRLWKDDVQLLKKEEEPEDPKSECALPTEMAWACEKRNCGVCEETRQAAKEVKAGSREDALSLGEPVDEIRANAVMSGMEHCNSCERMTKDIYSCGRPKTGLFCPFAPAAKEAQQNAQPFSEKVREFITGVKQCHACSGTGFSSGGTLCKECVAAGRVPTAYERLKSEYKNPIQYSDPHVDEERPWDYRKANSGS